ncbi:MAG: ATP-binding cassette domain-containing protein [Gammaproteobacteria bacterium]|nr:ATP-binding cassette domain-containing protein [Gammaproteobacteria bacterium]
MTELLKVENLSVRYSNGHQALEDINFSLPKATICALVGANGSGKSTLFKSIMGFVPASQGLVSIAGLPVEEAVRQQRIAYVPQTEQVDWDFPVSVNDVVMMGRYGHMGWLRRPKAADHEAVAVALEKVGMSAFAHRQIGQLSGGQKKRVFVARALAQAAELVLLDEPFTGVDVTSEAQIVELLRTLRDEGCLIVISTHNLGAVPDYCDLSIIIRQHLVAFGPTSDVLTAHNLQSAFGGKLRHHVLQHLGGESSESVTVFTDDERPLVLYPTGQDQSP